MLEIISMNKMRENADAINSEIFCEKFNIIIDIPLNTEFHIVEEYLMYSQDTLMNALG